MTSSKSVVGSVEKAHKADLASRFLAAIIDGAVVSTLSFFLGWLGVLGPLAGAAYIILRDSVEVGPFRHQSIGKYVTGLRAVRMDGQPLTMEDALQRNWMLALVTASSALGALWVVGGVMAGLAMAAGLFFFLYETRQMIKREDGRRWGDRRASTKVIETGDGLI